MNMRFVLKLIGIIVTTSVISACGSDEPEATQVIQQEIAVPSVTKEDLEPKVFAQSLPEPIHTETVPEPESIPEPAAQLRILTEEEVQQTTAATQQKSEQKAEAEKIAKLEARFRAGIVRAEAVVWYTEDDGGRVSFTPINTTDCLSDIKGVYRTCTSKKVQRDYPDAKYTYLKWKPDRYVSYYSID